MQSGFLGKRRLFFFFKFLIIMFLRLQFARATYNIMLGLDTAQSLIVAGVIIIDYFTRQRRLRIPPNTYYYYNRRTRTANVPTPSVYTCTYYNVHENKHVLSSYNLGGMFRTVVDTSRSPSRSVLR